MNRSKAYAASWVLYVLFFKHELSKLDSSGCAFVTAFDFPIVSEGKDATRLTKSQAVPGWRMHNFRSTSETEPEKICSKDVNPSELQGKIQTNVMHDQTEKSTNLTTKCRYGHNFSLLTKLMQQRFFNRFDEMDKMIIVNSLPLVGLTSVVPLMQNVDLFWVNQLGNTLAVSAQSAANSLYQFAFGLISFLPSVTATLVSKSFANNDIGRTENIIFTALLFGFAASSVISFTLFVNPSRYLGTIFKEGNPALLMSVKYMRIRCLSLIPQMVTYVCFAAFRGMLDYEICIKISLIASAFDLVLKPLLIHLFRFGILGSAISALVCDSFTALSYIKLMRNKGFIIRKKVSASLSWMEVSPLLKGSTLQARSFAMHSTNLIVARKIQSFDDSGVIPAAFSLAMQTFFTGGIFIYAMGMSAQTLYPNAIAKCKEEEKEIYSKMLIRRLLGRGFGVGIIIACIQALLFQIILRTTPLVEVREAAAFPIMIAIALQGINGIVSIGEAIMLGNGRFASASIVLVVASIGYTGCIQLFPQTWGINGVSISFVVFNLLRLIGFAAFLPSLMKQKPCSRSI